MSKPPLITLNEAKKWNFRFYVVGVIVGLIMGGFAGWAITSWVMMHG